MSTAKLAAVALLAAAFFTQSSIAAFAEDSESDDDSTSFIAPTGPGRPANPAPNERGDHGDRPKHKRDGDFQVAVPPMVITPDNDDAQGDDDGFNANPKQSFKVAPPGAGPAESVPDANGKPQVIEPKTSAFDPNANKPIELADVRVTKKSPADVFIESAQIGVGAMAAGAAVLGVTAAVRGVRFRRQENTDFIYEAEAKE